MKVKVLKIRLSERFIVADQKILDRFLAENNILKFESAFVNGKEAHWSVILYYKELKNGVKEPKAIKYATENSELLNADEIRTLDSLKLWRSRKAKDQSLPPYFIATNNELVSIAKYRPAKMEQLLDIKGFGKHKIENYGEEIIGILEAV